LSRWRLIVDGASHGAWNMGVDEALLSAAARGRQPALRLYRWSGPWLSLGYGQRLESQRREACVRNGIGLVRRVSGGGAVVHGSDLTYALAAPEAALPVGLAASYELIAGALVQALRAIGVMAAQPGKPATVGARPNSFDCFASAAEHEICVAGRKLAGSAQRRVQGGALQHGSIRLEPDAAGVREVLGVGAATSLAELGIHAAPEALQDACGEAFSRALGVDFEVGGLSSSERAWAHWRVRNHPQRLDFAPPAFDERTSRQPIADR
jgi:lipoate-protein ligase A